MAARRNAHCRVCGGHRSVVGQISARGKCAGCGDDRYIANHRAMLSRSGPWFRHWRRQVAAAVGAALVDEPGEPG